MRVEDFSLWKGLGTYGGEKGELVLEMLRGFQHVMKNLCGVNERFGKGAERALT